MGVIDGSTRRKEDQVRYERGLMHHTNLSYCTEVIQKEQQDRREGLGISTRTDVLNHSDISEMTDALDRDGRDMQLLTSPESLNATISQAYASLSPQLSDIPTGERSVGFGGAGCRLRSKRVFSPHHDMWHRRPLTKPIEPFQRPGMHDSHFCITHPLKRDSNPISIRSSEANCCGGRLGGL